MRTRKQNSDGRNRLIRVFYLSMVYFNILYITFLILESKRGIFHILISWKLLCIEQWNLISIERCPLSSDCSCQNIFCLSIFSMCMRNLENCREKKILNGVLALLGPQILLYQDGINGQHKWSTNSLFSTLVEPWANIYLA